ncbi:hypothetical protein THAOC_17257, partial [Thalassiosira oceanica]
MAGLVASIVAGNRRTARRAHLEALEVIPYTPGCNAADGDEGGDEEVPPPSARGPAGKRPGPSNEEWSNRARDVTGLHDALYSRPEEVPGYEEHNASFLADRTRFADAIRRKRDALRGRWTDLARTYLVRQHDYQKVTGVNTEEAGGVFCAAALMHNSEGAYGGGGPGGHGPGAGPESDLVPGVRGNNPYRRPRRGISPGDICRSDYEQEQIIAEIAAKEAMERRIREGGARSRARSGGSSGLVDDAQAEEDERKHVNVWSDMEKCIFLDRFLHHPKDFRKISSFLVNKSTKDCVRFYYDSKKTVPYKHALKEFLQRKKRRGDVVSWDATVQAALAVGAVVTEGTGPEDPVRISLPPGDYTYRTRSFHPMGLAAFDGLDEAVSHARQGDESAGTRHQGKRRRSNWFVLDAHEKRYLKHAGGDDDHHHHHRGGKGKQPSAASGRAAVDDSEEGEPGAGAGPPRK